MTITVAAKTMLIIRADGSEEIVKRPPAGEIGKLLGYPVLDYVYIGKAPELRNDLVMALCDNGWEYQTIERSPGHFQKVPIRPLLPINEKATKLYHAICKPDTTHQIAGDVGIVHDNEF